MAPPGTLVCEWLSGEEDTPSLFLGVIQLSGGLDRTKGLFPLSLAWLGPFPSHPEHQNSKL